MAPKKQRGRGHRRDFRRNRGNQRRVRDRYLVVCEGKQTEPLYFKALRNRHRLTTFEVEVFVGGEPAQLVAKAAGKRAHAKREGNPYDHVWCVFDRDDHGSFDQALTDAAKANLVVAFSAPCFEVWYLLHFGYSASAMTGPKVLERLRQHLPGYEKNRDVYAALLPYQEAALTNAERLRQHHESACSGPCPNPSTDVDRLVRALLDLAVC